MWSAPADVAEPAGLSWRHPGTHFLLSNVYSWVMRTNIEIDDALLAQAQELASTPTKKATVEYALRELVRRKDRRRVLELAGTVEWEGDLDASRRGR